MTSTKTRLDALIVDDSPENADRVVARLEGAGFSLTGRRIVRESEYIEALRAGPRPDIIIADDHLPQSDALRAIQNLQSLEVEIPFVVLAESSGDERAASCIRAGAFDYLHDGRLDALAPTVTRALARYDSVRKLRQSEERLRRTISVAPDPIIVSDSEGRILDWNPQAEKTFGWSREEALGATLASTIVPARFRAKHAEGLKRFVASGKGRLLNRRVEMAARTKLGAEIPVELTITPIRFGDGWIFSAFLRDLTEKKRAEKERELLHVQLLQSQKMEAVGLLAGGIAHDFNNILTVIMGQSQLLMNQTSLAPEALERVEIVNRAATRASSLTTQLLAFSRRQVLSPTLLDLNEVLSHMHEMLVRVIGEDIEIEMEFGERIGLIEADRSQIEQVVLNLVVNARDAMPEGGKISVSTASVVLDELDVSAYEDCAPGPYVTFRVRDRGVGMEASVMAKIFEPFFTTKELGRGTGLGLATVYGVVKQSRGLTRVASEKGKGTLLEVLIPQAQGERPKPKSSEASAPDGEGRILIVEDDDSVRALAREILEIAGYEVMTRSSAREALGLIERLEGRVDLVLTDLVLKGMNGKELAGLIEKRYPDVAVLFLSGYHNHPLIDAPSDGRPIVRKPFAPSDLTRAVSEALEPVDAEDDYV